MKVFAASISGVGFLVGVGLLIYGIMNLANGVGEGFIGLVGSAVFLINAVTFGLQSGYMMDWRDRFQSWQADRKAGLRTATARELAKRRAEVMQ